MAFKKQRIKNCGWRKSVTISLVLSVITPLVFLAVRAGSFTSAFGHKEFSDWPTSSGSERKLTGLEDIQENTEQLNKNIVGTVDFASSLVKEETIDVSRANAETYQDRDAILKSPPDPPPFVSKLELKSSSQASVPTRTAGSSVTADGPPKQVATDVVKGALKTRSSVPATKPVQNSSPPPPRKTDSKKANANDSLVRTLRDRLIMGKAYTTLAQAQNDLHLLQELKTQTKELQEMLSEVETDPELPSSARAKLKVMDDILEKAKVKHYDCAAMVKKLRTMVHATEQEGRMLKKQSVFLSQLAAKTVPKGLHCLSMRLSVEYYALPLEERQLPGQENLEDPSFYHYALFSDNVLAASVVVNSTVAHAKDPEKHVFHLVTDKLNYGAMKMWFLSNPPGNATVEVQNVDDFKWLNSSYCPVLRQLETDTMKEYYFRASNPTLSTGLKYRNPKYLSMLNHLRFYLPQMYPKLDKILFLDDDIVVQRDLSPLWSIDLHGNVNGAVETCGPSFHRFDKYLNFSNPLISKNFDPNACGWAYGMNIFDLRQWKAKDITGIYHRWQNMNEDRTLWKLGTLPPGLITFNNLTYPLKKQWHVLGLGYNAEVKGRDIHNAAVIHYNGNMKPWLEIGMAKYKKYWSKYVKFDHPYLVQCNINE